MNKILFCLILILNLMLLSSCTAYGPFPISHFYGDYVDYGEYLHPGIDFHILEGTPIIAGTEGVASYPWILSPNNGFCVELHHDKFRTFYWHLSKVYVEAGQVVKRGQLIGLSGVNYRNFPHLHFAILKLEAATFGNYSQTHDPAEFWLEGKPQCFDPNKDYSTYSVRDITLPVACGEYAKQLKNEARFLKETTWIDNAQKWRKEFIVWGRVWGTLFLN